METITVLDQQVAIAPVGGIDYISITDMARYRDEERTDYIIQNWLRNRDTIEFLGIWEHLNNPEFDGTAFDGFRRQAGLNRFTLTARRWIEATNATGLVSRGGRRGGIFAHPDIAFEFASWVAVEFKLYLIKEFQRIKSDELERLGWDIRRNLVKLNYRIHTEAIRQTLVPNELSAEEKSAIYRSEADVLNMALFGRTAAEWREANPDDKGNLRDQANMWQLVTLSNLENLNAHFIRENMPQAERLERLNRIAIDQMRLLAGEGSVRLLEPGEGMGLGEEG